MKDMMVGTFNDGFNQVVVPVLEEISGRLGRVEHRLDGLEAEVNELSTKVDNCVASHLGGVLTATVPGGKHPVIVEKKVAFC